MNPQIYTDTSYFIELIYAHSLRHTQAINALAGLLQAPRISNLVHMECLVRPYQAQDATLERTIKGMLQQCVDLPLTREVFDSAAKLRAQTNLKTPDAIHVACAIFYGCDEIWTYDAQLLAANIPIKAVAP